MHGNWPPGYPKGNGQGPFTKPAPAPAFTPRQGAPTPVQGPPEHVTPARTIAPGTSRSPNGQGCSYCSQPALFTIVGLPHQAPQGIGQEVRHACPDCIIATIDAARSPIVMGDATLLREASPVEDRLRQVEARLEDALLRLARQ